MEKMKDSGMFGAELEDEKWVVSKQNIEGFIETLDLEDVVQPSELEAFLAKQGNSMPTEYQIQYKVVL